MGEDSRVAFREKYDLHSISCLLPCKLSEASNGSGSNGLYCVFSTEFNDLLFLT